MSRFGPEPRAFFEGVYRGEAPWDIGEAQPGMVALLAEYPPGAPVLDVGCGSGDLAIHLAARGLETLGVDFVDRAIEQATAKKAALSPDIASRLRFEVADALDLERRGRTFGAIVDSGFLHLFGEQECDRLAEAYAKLLRPGGCCYLHEFAVTFAMPNVPRAISGAELRRHFSPHRGWRCASLREGTFASRVGLVPAILACFEYAGRNA
jgi:cyclopropane fatty-acyl-phospholipid synthase-like methyltransferase